jgi:hypothetical protein
MKNLKSTILFLILNILFDLQILNGQEEITYNQGSRLTVPGSEEFLFRLRLSRSGSGVDKITYSSIVGNPFLYKDFTTGKLIMNTGEVFQLDMRYDIYSNQIQFKNNDEIFEVVNQDQLNLIIIDTVIFKYSSYLKSSDDEAPGGNSWFILKTSGECNLLVKKNIRIQDAQSPKAYADAKPAEFIPLKDTYYLKLDDKSALRINNKKDLMNILADKKDELNGFIESNRLDIKNIDDFTKIIKFYNSL